jgi:putative sigma-54 modulation protein
MQLHVKGKNLEVSDSIRSYAERKLSKLDKQLSRLVRVEVELAVEKNPSIKANQVAEATVWLKGHTLRAREASRDMKASIDELTEKLLRQIKDERDKRTSRRKSGGKPALNGDTPVELE